MLSGQRFGAADPAELKSNRIVTLKLTATGEGVAVNIVRQSGKFAMLGFAALVLGSCVVEEGPRPLPSGSPGLDRPQACTMEYMPVCAQRGNQRQTFGNSCSARAEGFRVVHNGECRGGERPTPPPPQQRACTREFAPVCGQRGGRLQTFSNACEAGRADFRIVHRGQCEGLPRRR